MEFCEPRLLSPQYGKAVNYYKEAVKSEDNSSLRYDLADLQMRLRQHEKAERTVMQAIDRNGGGGSTNDLNSLMMQAKCVREIKRAGGGRINSSWVCHFFFCMGKKSF